MGLDYGDNRVGIALTDPLGIIVSGYKTIITKGNDKILLKELEKIIEEKEIGTVVVGMPVNMNGTLGKRAEKTEEFIHKLKCKFNKIKIASIDERLTTVQASKTMAELELDQKKRKEVVDTLSAGYILETYISIHMLKKEGG